MWSTSYRYSSNHRKFRMTLAPPHYPPIFALIITSVLAIGMLAMTIRYFMAAGRLDPKSIPAACRRQRDQLKYLAILSLATGVLVTVYEAQRALIQAAIAGSGLNHAIGPLAAAPFALEFGLANVTLCSICMILVLARSSRLIARTRD